MGRRGRPARSGRRLSAEQEEHIQRLIKDHRPEQLKMDFALWTRAAVMLLIGTRRSNYTVDLPRVGRVVSLSCERRRLRV
jgi:hypothetical protein